MAKHITPMQLERNPGPDYQGYVPRLSGLRASLFPRLPSGVDGRTRTWAWNVNGLSK